MFVKIIFCIIAGLIFAVGDMGHIYSGMAQYPHWQGPLFFNIPWWVPFEFAGAAFFMLQTQSLTNHFFKLSEPSKVSPYLLLTSFLWTLLIYLGSSFIPESHSILKILTLLFAVALQIKWNQMFYLGSILEIITVAIGGCSFEYILGQLEVFTYYPSPSTFGTIPLWLPFIYASVAITVRITHTSINKIS